MERGRDVLIVYDDLTKHADALPGAVACCCGGRPGREAYPGDIFYAHARLWSGPAASAKSTAAAP